MQQKFQESEKDAGIELERARGVISQFEEKLNILEKERSKESKLRKEEQNRLLELIEQRQKFESEVNHQRKYIDIELKKTDTLKLELSNANNKIVELKDSIKNLNDEISKEVSISSSKSETIKDYERRIDTYNEKLSENSKIINEMKLELAQLSESNYAYKNEVLEKANDIKYLSNKLREIELRQEVSGIYEFL